jgi:hypothetical protein
VQGARAFGTAGSRLAASGDIDHDRTDDLVWQSGDGTVNVWNTRSGVIWDTATIAAQGWDVVARGAFEGAPGEQDLLWRNSVTGQLVEWGFGIHQGDVLIV